MKINSFGRKVLTLPRCKLESWREMSYIFNFENYGLSSQHWGFGREEGHSPEILELAPVSNRSLVKLDAISASWVLTIFGRKISWLFWLVKKYLCEVFQPLKSPRDEVQNSQKYARIVGVRGKDSPSEPLRARTSCFYFISRLEPHIWTLILSNLNWTRNSRKR